MPDANMPTDLQALWDELNQSDDVRRERVRQERFDERAKHYAQPTTSQTSYSDDEVYKLLTFSSADERYGIDVNVVQGVRAAENITRVPGVPAYYRGVINIRGQIVSVLDLRHFFGLSPSIAKEFELILIQTHDLSLALLADRIDDVQFIPRTSITPFEMRYAHGVTSDHLVILDIDYLLSDERLIIGGESYT
ncbi:MAG: chemotaxis protein CheW [Phototrophicaceae bacterium]